jgi:hypothetical protein
VENSGLSMGVTADALVERAGGIIEMPGAQVDLRSLDALRFGVGGYFTVEVWDAEGHLKGRLDHVRNGVTSTALDHILNVALRGQTQQTSWYLGLVGADSWTTGFNAADTMTSHNGWAEGSSSELPVGPPGWDACRGPAS